MKRQPIIIAALLIIFSAASVQSAKGQISPLSAEEIREKTLKETPEDGKTQRVQFYEFNLFGNDNK